MQVQLVFLEKGSGAGLHVGVVRALKLCFSDTFRWSMSCTKAQPVMRWPLAVSLLALTDVPPAIRQLQFCRVTKF